MASGRSLGGGRVLGTGKSLAPPTPPPAAPQPATNKVATLRSPGLLSPSESSVSLSSQTSSTPLSTEHEDITSRVALDEQGSAQAAAATSKMVCPICNDEMVTLLQLNRHIDDNHANLEEIEQEQAKNWFKQRLKKAKKFQPLQMLNQKLRGLEVFESNNDAVRQVSSAAATPPTQDSRGASPAPAHSLAPPPPPTVSSPDPEDIITRAHWQRPTGQDVCSDPMCGKRLGAGSGQVNCRHCGKLFCDEHTMYQMKLSRSANHEPVRGLWYRVCETCYKTRPGYNDHDGFQRSHFEYFRMARRKMVDKQYLETSRLETRLTRLTQLLADPPPPDNKAWSIWSTLSGDRDRIRTLEQSVVSWENDASIVECPFCQQPFSQYTLRRHHCRTCGRVVCGDPATGCSSAVGLNVDKMTDLVSEKPTEQKVALDIRMCKDCQRTIFSKADFAREISTQTPDQRGYQNLLQFEEGIRLLMPRFQRLLQTMQDAENPPTSVQLAEASKVRKRLTDAFTQYDVAARRIRDLPTESPTQTRLQEAVYKQAASFLHVHMLPLKSIPKIIKQATANGSREITSANVKPKSALSSITNGHRPGSSRHSSTSSAAVIAIEAEEKELHERLIVLEEQKFMVSEMIADANKRRKYDEAGSLTQNVDDLVKEMEGIQRSLASMDFSGAYASNDSTVK